MHPVALRTILGAVRRGPSATAAVAAMWALLATPNWLAAEHLSSRLEATQSITRNELHEHVELLASDALEGREAGTRGGHTAGNYLVRQIKDQLEPGGTNQSFFQPFQRYRNILGWLPGGDPELAHEVIVVGAHYDHVGYGTYRNSRGPIGRVHNGADDNASGTSAMLEVIEAFSKTERPRRSILFAFWDGEEQGLLGSEHWAQHPTIDISRVRLAVNLDMIGRLEDKPLEVIGTRSMSGLRELLARANHGNTLRLNFPWTIEENSDHHSFFRRGIAVTMFHTGLHDDYHTPRDDTELIDMDGLRQTSQFLFRAICALADADQLQAFRTAARYENNDAQRAYEASVALPPPRLGITWVPSVQEAGLVVQSASPQSAAFAAGIRPGDRIVSQNGHPILSSSSLQQVVACATEITLGVVGAGETEEKTVSVRLSGLPSRIGVSWRETPAEPGTVTVVRVVPHTVAHQADLRIGDRIYELDGHPFRDSDDLAERAQAISLPSTILIERNGQLSEKILPSLPAELAVAEHP